MSRRKYKGSLYPMDKGCLYLPRECTMKKEHFKKRPCWNLNRAIVQYGFTPVELSQNAEYEANKTYWCGYWVKWYRVLNAVYENHGRIRLLKSVTVQWQDGTTTTHCTNLDPQHDWELIGNA